MTGRLPFVILFYDRLASPQIANEFFDHRFPLISRGATKANKIKNSNTTMINNSAVIIASLLSAIV
jgi:hypothetical protein